MVSGVVHAPSGLLECRLTSNSADVLGRNEITSGEVSEMDCFRWEEDISDHEQALILHGLQGFDLK